MKARIDKPELDQIGFQLSEFPQDQKHARTSLALAKIVAEGNELGETIGCSEAFLEARSTLLEPHVECIYENPPLHYFAVASLQEPECGGEVSIFDARLAARIILTECPELASVEIRYPAGSSYPGRSATHPLVSNDPIYGAVLRIRLTPKANVVGALPSGWNENGLYNSVGQTLERSRIALLPLSTGSIIYVNNRITVHAQQPYAGVVHYLRVRFDDPNNILMHI